MQDIVDPNKPHKGDWEQLPIEPLMRIQYRCRVCGRVTSAPTKIHETIGMLSQSELREFTRKIAAAFGLSQKDIDGE